MYAWILTSVADGETTVEGSFASLRLAEIYILNTYGEFAVTDDGEFDRRHYRVHGQQKLLAERKPVIGYEPDDLYW